MSNGKFVEMWKPIKIGSVTIKNRFYMAPMGCGFVDKGRITQQYISYFARRARGGAGLIVAPAGLHLTGGSRMTSNLADLAEPADKYMLNELAETIHAFDAKLFIQTMAGSFGRQVPRGVPTRAPSAVPLRIPPEMYPRKEEEFRQRVGLYPDNWEKFRDVLPPPELTIEEIREIEDVWAQQCLLAKEAGVDGVELHWGHGYLVHSFLSPIENLRADEYGGSFDNRFRICRNILAKARTLVGSDFPIGARLAGSDEKQGGVDTKLMAQYIKAMEELGLNFVDLSRGCYERAKYYFPDDDGNFVPLAEELKHLGVEVPILCPAIHNPKLGEETLREGKIDMIGLGRPLLADPDYVNKVAADGPNAKLVKCIRCNVCDRRIRAFLGIRCEVNREVGMEMYDPANWRINAPKKKDFILV